jgi:hypothetical protein
VFKLWEPQPPGTLRSCTGIALSFEKFQQMHNKRGRTIDGFIPPTKPTFTVLVTTVPLENPRKQLY